MIDPNAKFPVVMSGTDEVWPHTMFLKNFIDQDNVIIGDYTYYNDFRKDLGDLRSILAPYLYVGAPEKLIIGKFVQIAHKTQFITSSANHQMDGFSSYPFAVFGEPWSSSYAPNWPSKGDTVIGNDVWLGHESIIMPGITIGDGAIIGSRAVVTKDVPPYTIVAGNPARVIRKRFSDEVIQQLIKIAWWDWPIDKITKNLEFIVGGDIGKLSDLA